MWANRVQPGEGQRPPGATQLTQDGPIGQCPPGSHSSDRMGPSVPHPGSHSSLRMGLSAPHPRVTQHGQDGSIQRPALAPLL